MAAVPADVDAVSRPCDNTPVPIARNPKPYGLQSPPYELLLAMEDIEHRNTKVRSPRTNGFVA